MLWVVTTIEQDKFRSINLYFRRWDTHAHRLADFHSSDPTLEIFPGQDYSDARLRDFEHGKSDMMLNWIYV